MLRGDFEVDFVFDSWFEVLVWWFVKGFVQQFYGIEVNICQLIFDVDIVMFMDFVLVGLDGLYFFYVLLFDV